MDLAISTTTGIGFLLVAALTLWLFHRALRKSYWVLMVGVAWMLLQAFLASAGFYAVPFGTPPRFGLAIGPAVVFALFLVFSSAGMKLAQQADLRALTLVHFVRLPVELLLHRLADEGGVPSVMTWEGRNFDIVMGLSAPIMAWWAFRSARLPKRVLVVWNVLGLLLLLNVVVHGVLSAPAPFQQFHVAAEFALLRSPFIWLPSVIVPLVLFGHVLALRKLMRSGSTG